MIAVFFFIAHEIKRVLNFMRNPKAKLAHILVRPAKPPPHPLSLGDNN